MAHNFLHAPSHLTINQALRWGQVTGLGGSENVARGILLTPLARSFNHEEFWVTVIMFFINNPFLDVVQYGPIYDYLNNKKFVSRGRRWIDNELVDLGPEQPNLSMKKRDPLALIEQVERWHRDLRETGWAGGEFAWESCGIKGFELKEKDVHYQITELLSTQELKDEGADMHHCVASYATSCMERRSAIYSLTKTIGGGSKNKRPQYVDTSAGTAFSLRRFEKK